MCDVHMHYISGEKIKTTRDQVTTHSNIPVSNITVLRLLLLNMKCVIIIFHL